MSKIAKKIHLVMGVLYINEFSFLQIIGLCERVIGLCMDVGLGAFIKLWKVIISFIMSVCPSVRPSIHPSVHMEQISSS